MRLKGISDQGMMRIANIHKVAVAVQSFRNDKDSEQSIYQFDDGRMLVGFNIGTDRIDALVESDGVTLSNNDESQNEPYRQAAYSYMNEAVQNPEEMIGELTSNDYAVIQNTQSVISKYYQQYQQQQSGTPPGVRMGRKER